MVYIKYITHYFLMEYCTMLLTECITECIITIIKDTKINIK